MGSSTQSEVVFGLHSGQNPKDRHLEYFSAARTMFIISSPLIHNYVKTPLNTLPMIARMLYVSLRFLFNDCIRSRSSQVNLHFVHNESIDMTNVQRFSDGQIGPIDDYTCEKKEKNRGNP